MVVAGEVFITDKNGEERRLGPGDLGFFPAGTSCIWRVPERVRKIAVTRETLWRPVGVGLKIWKRLLRIAEKVLGQFSIKPTPACIALIAALCC
jgi:hypothetical protein